MDSQHLSTWIAFANMRCIAQGQPSTVAQQVKQFSEHDQTLVLIFDAQTSLPIELDLRGSLEEVLQRLAAPKSTEPRSVGRPKLGVTAKEVTLLPKHWDWLATQSGGASVALRKLVEQAMRAPNEADGKRQAIEATYRFMQAVAGNLPQFEEASRALFAGQLEAFEQQIQAWPEDIRQHTLNLCAQIK